MRWLSSNPPHPTTPLPQSHFNIGNKQGFSDIAVAHPTTVAPKEARGFVVLASARAVRKVTLQVRPLPLAPPSLGAPGRVCVRVRVATE